MFILEICNNQTIKNIHVAAKINPVLAATDAHYAYKYAINIIDGRFELGEKAISTSSYYSYQLQLLMNELRLFQYQSYTMKPFL